MARWSPYAHDRSGFAREAAALRRAWPRLHAGDCEPWPADEAVVEAWRLFHAGELRAAFDAGLAADGAGITVANAAECVQADHLERAEKTRLAMLLAAAERAEARQREEPRDPNAFYWQAFALGRYGQRIGVARALAEGIGGKVKRALERTIVLAPRHGDAHVALGTFHAEVIHHVGGLLGRLQGADAAAGVAAFRRGLKLRPASPGGMLEAAAGLLVLEGSRARAEAVRLRAAAAAHRPLDALERLDVERARNAAIEA